MAVKIRLTRMGAKKKPVYRIVASDSRSPRDGKYNELIGTYDPNKNPADIKINEEVALKWLKNGAVPTDTAKNLLSKAGIIKKFADSKKGHLYMDLVLLTEKLVKALAVNKDLVSVKEFETDEENTVLIQVMVDSEDIGRVIGKAGRNANAVRTIVQASSYLNDNKKVKINIDSF